MLQQLTGKAFDTMKFMAEDDSWFNDRDNGQKLLDEMSKPDRFGKAEIESLWNALHRLLYAKMKTAEDDLISFRNRFEEATRKVAKHGVVLPEAALGFIFLKQAQVDESTLERIVTITKGDLALPSVVEAMAKLKMRLIQSDEDKRKPHAWLQEPFEGDDVQTESQISGHLENDELDALENALVDLENPEDEHISENDAKEILMTLIRQRVQKPVQNLNYRQVQNIKQDLRTGRGFRAPNASGGPTMKKDITHLKSITQCRNCGRTGHWHRECPLKNQSRNTGGSQTGQGSTLSSGPTDQDPSVKAWFSLAESMQEASSSATVRPE